MAIVMGMAGVPKTVYMGQKQRGWWKKHERQIRSQGRMRQRKKAIRGTQESQAAGEGDTKMTERGPLDLEERAKHF